MSDGWIKLHRKCLDTGILKNHKIWVFWSYCLMKASHKEHKQIIGNQELILQPGQFVIGRDRAANDLDMSHQNIRTCIAFLKKHKNLTIKPTNKFSIITLTNWDTYQHKDSQANQQTNQCLTSNQPAPNQHLTTNKNVKNENNVENGKKNTYSENFETFWLSYPKQKSKKQAFKTWSKLLKEKTLPDLETLIRSLQTLKSSNEWLKSKGKYIPYPSSWLNAGGWDDNPDINMPNVSDTQLHNHRAAQEFLDE